MVVKLSRIILSLFCVLSINTIAQADSELEKAEILKGLQTSVAKSTLKLSEKIKACENIESKVTHTINNDSLKANNKDQSQLLKGLAHLSIQNMFKCVSKEKKELAFNLGILKTVKAHYQLETKEISDIESNLIYPSIKEVQLAINYSKLPSEMKAMLEKTVGESPFDLIGTLKKNHLGTYK